jgi:parallel beta-helix repeat protein
MLLIGVSDSLITKNVVTHNGDGIILKGSSGNLITENLVVNTTAATNFEASHSNTVSVNKISNTTGSAIHFEDSSNNIISDNYVDHNGQGLTLNRGSNNSITGNTIIYNTGKGAHIGESINNTITGNNFAWNKYYAITTSGEVGNNVIHHNDFVNNKGEILQTLLGSKSPSGWDDGSEGNFWSDYQRAFPTGKELAGTTVMDTPYVMNDINVDRFPLINPVDMKYHVVLVQPENKSYDSDTLSAVFFVTAPDSWISYSLDNNENVTVQENTISLSNLSTGSHKLTVYGGQNGTETCTTKTVYFTIGSGTTEPEPEQTEPDTANQEPAEPETTNDEPTQPTKPFLLLNDGQVVIIAVAVACCVFVVWFLARKKSIM